MEFQQITMLNIMFDTVVGRDRLLIRPVARSAALQAIDLEALDSGSVPSEQPGGGNQQQQSHTAQHHDLGQDLQQTGAIDHDRACGIDQVR